MLVYQRVTSHCPTPTGHPVGQLLPPHHPGHDELDDQRDDEHAQAKAGVKTWVCLKMGYIPNEIAI